MPSVYYMIGIWNRKWLRSDISQIWTIYWRGCPRKALIRRSLSPSHGIFVVSVETSPLNFVDEIVDETIIRAAESSSRQLRRSHWTYGSWVATFYSLLSEFLTPVIPFSSGAVAPQKKRYSRRIRLLFWN